MMVLSLIGNIMAIVGLLLILASWTYLYQWAHQGPKTALSHFMEKGLLFIGLALIVIALLFF
ncbi:MAG: hypothetical protein ACFFCH_02275 [Promethearchaeota archaeon]